MTARKRTKSAAPVDRTEALTERIPLRHGLTAILVLRPRCPLDGEVCGCVDAATGYCAQGKAS